MCVPDTVSPIFRPVWKPPKQIRRVRKIDHDVITVITMHFPSKIQKPFPTPCPKTIDVSCVLHNHTRVWYTCLHTPTYLVVLRVRVYYNTIFLRVCAYYYFTSITLSLTHTYTRIQLFENIINRERF